MDIIPVQLVSEEELQEFLAKNQNVNQENLFQNGYIVKINKSIEGCFVLDTVEEDVYWLKQLYITQTKANRLPVLIETILTLAKQQQAKCVYVYSHQPGVDVLLEALQFYPEKEQVIVDNPPQKKGNWWAYHVS